MKRKIKVVIAINDFLIGGAQRLITDQLKYFDKNKFDFYLITFFIFSDKKNFYKKLPKEIPVFKFNFKNFLDILSWLKLIKLLIQIRPSIVISHLFFSNTIMRILKPFFGYKIIIVEHNTYRDRKKFFIFLNKILSFLTYKIVAVSFEVRNYLILNEKINAKKITVIHNGIDLEEINKYKKNTPFNQQELKKELGFSPVDKIIINVGRLTAQKNQKLLISSFFQFSKFYPEYKLIILGEGSLYGELKDLIEKLGVNDRIFLMGAREDIYKFYLVSDFFISTSEIEGLSLSHLEALSFGLPLVVTKTGGTDEIVKEGVNGFFINEFSIESAVHAMKKAVNSDLNFLKKNALLVAEKFDIVTNVNKYTRLMLKE